MSLPVLSKTHAALIFANIFFGTGAVLGALGLPATHPLVFALVREIGAGILLLTISVLLYGSDKSPRNIPVLWSWLEHWKSFVMLGLMVFGNQAAFIVGVKLAGPITASVWQPSQPIFTAAICMALGWEPVRRMRLIGILVAFVGCVTMVMLKTTRSSTVSALSISDEQQSGMALVSESLADDHRTSETINETVLVARYVIGNGLFFLNCLCTSLYVILSKRMLALYPPVLVTAWSYNTASLFMFTATLMATNCPGAATFFCPECPIIANPIRRLFHIPNGAVPALLYYILFASVGSYGLITWANQHATGTLVMSYTVLQPVTSTIFTILLLFFGIVTNCQIRLVDDRPCLDFPNWGTVCGMMGVFAGLALIILTEPSYHRVPDEMDSKRNDSSHSERDLLVKLPIPNETSRESVKSKRGYGES